MIEHKHKGFLKGVKVELSELSWTKDIIFGYRFKTRRESELYWKKMYRLGMSGRLSQTHPIKVNAQKEEYYERLPVKEWPHWRPSVVREMHNIRKIQGQEIELFPEMKEYQEIFEEG
jgi:hypothetical protein